MHDGLSLAVINYIRENFSPRDIFSDELLRECGEYDKGLIGVRQELADSRRCLEVEVDLFRSDPRKYCAPKARCLFFVATNGESCYGVVIEGDKIHVEHLINGVGYALQEICANDAVELLRKMT
jgi:hypothetical protein